MSPSAMRVEGLAVQYGAAVAAEEVSIEIATGSVVSVVGGGVCNITTAGGRDLPAVPDGPTRADAASTDPLPATSGNAGAVSCEQMSKDAAQTTLMLIEIQRWYERESKTLQ